MTSLNGWRKKVWEENEMSVDEAMLSADERQRFELDRLSAVVMEFALYRTFCDMTVLKKDSADSLSRFMELARSRNYKFIGEV